MIYIALTHHPTFPPSMRHQASAGNASVHLHSQTPSLLCCRFTAHFSSASLFLTPPTDIDKCIVTIATPQAVHPWFSN